MKSNFIRRATHHQNQTHPADPPPPAPHPPSGAIPASSSSSARQGVAASPAASFQSQFSSSSSRRHLPPPGDLLHQRIPAAPASPADSQGTQVFVGHSGGGGSRSREMVSGDDGRISPRSSPRASLLSEQSDPSDDDSPPASPRSTDPPSQEDRRSRRHSPRDKSGAHMATPPRKVNAKQRVSPLAKRLGEDVPFMLPHPSFQDSTTNQAYPGVVIGAFAGSGSTAAALGFGENEMNFSGSVDDILDPAARGTRDGRSGSTSAQPAGANIAPWLMDDSAPTSQMTTPAASQNPSRNGSVQALNHSASTPALPKVRRQGTVHDSETSGSASHVGSNPSIFPIPDPAEPGPSSSENSSKETSRSRQGSGDSAQTLNVSQRGKKHVSPTTENPPHARQTSAPGQGVSRMSRFGSTASSVGPGSVGSERKKGFLGGFLKRKGTAAGLPMDFAPSDGSHRGSGSGSASSKLSASASHGSLSQKRSYPALSEEPSDMTKLQTTNQRNASYASEGAISPLHEIREPEFQLDMDLDNMEGIVDPTLANAPPQQPQPFRLPQTGTGSTSETVTSAPSTAGSMQLGQALHDTHSFATTVSSGSSGSQGGSGSGSGSGPAPGRTVLSETDRVAAPPFMRINPFSSSTGVSPASSLDGKPHTPPSPHTLSPKHSLPASTHPRRPSQLRNVKLNSMDSEASSTDLASLQPLAPAWAAAPSTGASQTMFNDPFGSSRPATAEADESAATIEPPKSASGSISAAASTLASMAAAAAAWAAPESWGVEGDAMPDDTSSSSSSEEDGYVEDGDDASAAAMARVGSLAPSTASGGRKPPPFGYKSGPGGVPRGSKGSTGRPDSSRVRGKTPGGGRPSTGGRPTTGGRPGTSGSGHTSSALPHWLRIYRADGSYTLLSLPLHATTAEVIHALNQADGGASKKANTNMRLYLRERGQDRLLVASERPLAIQDRRLRQAGYTEAEKVEELGKKDLLILCKFIYQTPVLPVMDPEEESSYDSFEFIDVAGRDLQTVPIFLHLHAHNIIILNLSRNPMTDLPLDFIQACTSLKELRMSNMALKRVPASIRASASLSRLDVSSNRIADLESVPLHEITTLLSLKVQNNKLASIPSYFAQMKALKYLNISNNKFETFPAVVCEMSNLVDLDVSFNNISELPSEMSNLKSLERLAVFGNDLTTFPESFSTLANLRVLDVRRNKLTDLTSVYALPNLATLQADQNNLVTLDAQIGARVRQFSVPHNSITRFTLAPLPNMAAVTYSLTHLNLSHGKISTLADEALSGLVNLIELNLNFNQFTRLPPTLSRLANLEILSCTDNMLNSLPPGMGRLQKLRILNVHNNNLKALGGELWAIGTLESINASSNLLDSADEEDPKVFERLGLPDPYLPGPDGQPGLTGPPAARNLRSLYLGDNRFSDEVFHSLAPLVNLKVLNLSFNDIYEIPSNTVNHFTALEGLYLSGNKLTSLPAEDFEKLQNLKVLHLNGNKLQTLPSELGALKALQHLDVGSNVLKYNIANWPYDWNWNWNTALRYLNLSGNKRLEIKPSSAQDMTHASSFRKELSDFTALTQLRVLGLMDVTLRISTLPDESEDKRVRTSFSDINHMKYGISDMLGTIDHLAMFDMVVPNFRGNDNECLFGMFGRAAPSVASAAIPKFLQESFANALSQQLERLDASEDATQALRRTFLSTNRSTFEHLVSGQEGGTKSSTTGTNSIDPMFRNWHPTAGSVFRSGSSGAVVYLVDKVIHVGNVGDTLVVISRKGEAELLSKHHDPTDREETARIRRAEAWVSTKGYVNDDKDIDISRAMGYYQHVPAVNASPEIRTRQLAETDEFVIIGNAGLWNCCSYQTAVDIARTERDDPMMAAQKLRDFAISYGADTSVMVMVVNISDLFFAQGRRPRGIPGSGSQAVAEGGAAQDGAKRNLRRRYEEVGDRTLNRLQQEIEPPTGQVAIVFTDIVNSTHLWETNQAMPTAIKMHHNLMRRQLRLDGGYEVKTEGDSFMVSFQTVTAALLWCFNCQIGLLQQEWPRELLEAHDGKVVYDSEGNLVQRGLRVRMGIHWGSPQCERDPITRRMDYYGPMVNRAARINASADGGQLMASQDVINEIQAVRDYLDNVGEGEGAEELPPELKREAMELGRIGLEVKEMGSRKLKGLEVPEKLHLLYPRTLAGRFEISNDIRPAAEVAVDPRSAHAVPRVINIDEVRELSKLTLRLEALCSAAAQPQQKPVRSPPTSPVLGQQISPATAGGGGATMDLAPSKMLFGPEVVPGSTPAHAVGIKLPPPAYLGPRITEDMHDEELGVIIESLTGRIENCMSSLYIKHLGGFSSVLAALEQATRIDPRLLVHAMALMDGAMRP